MLYGSYMNAFACALSLTLRNGLCRRVSHYLLENGGDGQMTPLLRLGSGACAGIIGMTATYPLDMVRGRLTVQAGKEYTGILHATRMIVKQVCTPSSVDPCGSSPVGTPHSQHIVDDVYVQQETLQLFLC